jgi:hypothetical protein
LLLLLLRRGELPAPVLADSSSSGRRWGSRGQPRRWWRSAHCMHMQQGRHSGHVSVTIQWAEVCEADSIRALQVKGGRVGRFNAGSISRDQRAWERGLHPAMSGLSCRVTHRPVSINTAHTRLITCALSVRSSCSSAVLKGMVAAHQGQAQTQQATPAPTALHRPPPPPQTHMLTCHQRAHQGSRL